MSAKPRFILYRKEHDTHRFRIAPANPLGVVVFLINLALCLIGVFEVRGMYGVVPPLWGGLMLALGVAFFIYSMMFLTDYSKPGD